MFYARWSRLAKTLRFRLTIWNLLVIVLSSLVTLLGVRHGVKLAILHEMDQILIEDLYEINYKLVDAGTTLADVRLARSDIPSHSMQQLLDDLDRKARGHEHHGWFVELREVTGPLLWSSEGAPSDLRVGRKLADFQPLTVPDLRIVQHRPTIQGDSPLIVRVGAATEFLDRDMVRIDRLVALATTVVLLVAPPIGYWLAGRATRPLGNLIRTASQLRPARMDERLPLRRTGDELDQLAETVNSLLDRIADYLDQRRDFLANSAHELRSPVAAIRSMAEVALGDDRSTEEYEQLLVDIVEECGSLEKLVSQLLLLGEAETIALRNQMECVNLSSLLQRAGDMFQAMADVHGITLQVDIAAAVLVNGHSHLLRQVLNNLLDNALKFTPSGGHVHVSLHGDVSSARLVVEDTGPGIPADDLPRVFERFFRGDRARSRDHETRGTGLGLSICQSVVESHGGQMLVTSQMGQGTTFTVVLPRSAGSPGSSC